jgi:hypothetical protein
MHLVQQEDLQEEEEETMHQEHQVETLVKGILLLQVLEEELKGSNLL